MDLIRPLMAYDEVMDIARLAGREPSTADKIHALRAAIAAYEADKAQAYEEACNG